MMACSEASQAGNPDILLALIGAGADVNKARAGGVTPVYVAAVNNGSTGFLKELIGAGADVNRARTGVVGKRKKLEVFS
jgi:ankyrin repeat protein